MDIKQLKKFNLNYEFINPNFWNDTIVLLTAISNSMDIQLYLNSIERFLLTGEIDINKFQLEYKLVGDEN